MASVASNQSESGSYMYRDADSPEISLRAYASYGAYRWNDVEHTTMCFMDIFELEDNGVN